VAKKELLKKVQHQKEVKKHHKIALRLYIILGFFGGLMLSSCRTVSIYESGDISNERKTIIEDARGLLGSSYEYAARGPKKFDCSGYVGYVYNLSGMRISGSASHLLDQGRPININDALPGDLIFYKHDGRVFHVSMITQNRGDELWVIHSTTSRGVIEEDILASTYWRPMIYKTVSLRSYK